MAGAGDILGTITGSKKDREKALAALEGIGGEYDAIETPDYLNVDLEGPQYAGDVIAQTAATPENISVDPITAAKMQASTVGSSAMEDISGDPRLREAQLNALSSLEGIADAGGMTAMDEANMGRMISQVNQQDRGRREAIDQQMARRGMGGSGMELLAKLQSSQGATDRAAQQGLDIQGMAQARALEAMMQSGQLGGSIRGQDFGEDAAKAQAADAISRFNAGQTQAANQVNTGALNNANQFNANMSLNTQGQNVGNQMQVAQNNANAFNNVAMNNQGVRQGVNNLAAGYSNQSQMHNNFTAPTQNFQNQMTKTDGKTKGTVAIANQHNNNALADDEAAKQIATTGAKIYTAGA